MIDVPAFRNAIFDVAAARGTVGMSAHAYEHVTRSSSKPRSPRSPIFSGKRIRVLASEGEQSAIASLGGSSVPMSLPEVLPALQQGTIDGVNSVLGVLVAFRYHDAAQNLVDTALWPILSISLVSRIFYDRLPPDLQKIVLETGAKIEPELAKWQIARIASDTKSWTDKGGKIVKLWPDDQQEAVRRVSGGRRRWSPRALGLKDLLRSAQGHSRHP